MILDYDPTTGKTTHGKHEDGRMVIYTVEDVEPQLEAAKALRNDPEYWKRGVKAGFAHYAHIPDTKIIEWMAKGLNIYSPEVTLAEIFKRVNEEIPAFKVTDKHHQKHAIWS